MIKGTIRPLWDDSPKDSSSDVPDMAREGPCRPGVSPAARESSKKNMELAMPFFDHEREICPGLGEFFRKASHFIMIGEKKTNH